MPRSAQKLAGFEAYSPGEDGKRSVRDEVEQCYREHTTLQTRYLKQMSFLANKRRAEIKRRNRSNNAS